MPGVIPVDPSWSQWPWEGTSPHGASPLHGDGKLQIRLQTEKKRERREKQNSAKPDSFSMRFCYLLAEK